MCQRLHKLSTESSTRHLWLVHYSKVAIETACCRSNGSESLTQRNLNIPKLISRHEEQSILPEFLICSNWYNSKKERFYAIDTSRADTKTAIYLTSIIVWCFKITETTHETIAMQQYYGETEDHRSYRYAQQPRQTTEEIANKDLGRDPAALRKSYTNLPRWNNWPN